MLPKKFCELAASLHLPGATLYMSRNWAVIDSESTLLFTKVIHQGMALDFGKTIKDSIGKEKLVWRSAEKHTALENALKRSLLIKEDSGYDHITDIAYQERQVGS